MEKSKSLVIKTSRNGLGLFVCKNYQPNKKILQIKGKRVNYKLLLKLKGTFQDNCFRFGPVTYIDPTNQFGEFLNHSCQPNCKIVKFKTKLFLYTIDEIKPGDELTIDYSTILASDDTWTMNCNCGQRQCRHLIKKYTLLPKHLLQKYQDEKIIPEYILRL